MKQKRPTVDQIIAELRKADVELGKGMHWHFVVKPNDKDELSSYFQHLSGTHAKRFRSEHRTIGQGHVYQDRFKSFPVQSDEHLLSLCRYVERNALRAGIVARAEDWPWSALYRRLQGTDEWLMSTWPVPRPADWVRRVNQPLTDAELQTIRASVRRGRPLGTSEWIQETAQQLGLSHTLRTRGRPATAFRE